MTFFNLKGRLNSRVVVYCLIVLSWVWSIIISLPPLFGWSKFVPESNGMR
jgi:hypothetical protein